MKNNNKRRKKNCHSCYNNMKSDSMQKAMELHFAGARSRRLRGLHLNMKSNICEITSFDLIELKLITT